MAIENYSASGLLGRLRVYRLLFGETLQAYEAQAGWGGVAMNFLGLVFGVEICKTCAEGARMMGVDKQYSVGEEQLRPERALCIIAILLTIDSPSKTLQVLGGALSVRQGSSCKGVLARCLGYSMTPSQATLNAFHAKVY